MIVAGLYCPKCKKSNIRGGDLDDSVFASLDCLICNDCGFRWFFAHQPSNITENNIKKLFDDNFIWVLCTRDLDFIDKKIEGDNGKYPPGNTYCKGCIYRSIFGYICFHPESKHEISNDNDYFEKKFDYFSCSIKNFHNKCKNYTKKPRWMFWK